MVARAVRRVVTTSKSGSGPCCQISSYDYFFSLPLDNSLLYSPVHIHVALGVGGPSLSMLLSPCLVGEKPVREGILAGGNSNGRTQFRQDGGNTPRGQSAAMAWRLHFIGNGSLFMYSAFF
jgi:hypothetical protein